MKKEYISPKMEAVKICPSLILVNSIPVGEDYKGGSVQARRYNSSTWDDDFDEE